MEREAITQLCEREVLANAARLFGTSKDALGKFDDYEGCANLVYQYEREGQPRVLRISYRPERPVELIQAELHFVNYLADGGVRVSTPVLSENGNLLEVIHCRRDTLYRCLVRQRAGGCACPITATATGREFPSRNISRIGGRCSVRCTGWQKPTSRSAHR